MYLLHVNSKLSRSGPRTLRYTLQARCAADLRAPPHSADPLEGHSAQILVVFCMVEVAGVAHPRQQEHQRRLVFCAESNFRLAPVQEAV